MDSGASEGGRERGSGCVGEVGAGEERMMRSEIRTACACEGKSGPGVDCQNSVSGTTLKRALGI